MFLQLAIWKQPKCESLDARRHVERFKMAVKLHGGPTITNYSLMGVHHNHAENCKMN